MDLSDAFAYAAPVLRHTDGMRMHYVPVPPEVADALREAGTRRIVGTINGHPIRRALHGIGDGDYQLLIGRRALREVGGALGETLVLELMPDPDPDFVDIPEELQAALDADEEAAARWATFTPGKRRSLSIHVAQAKRPATRERRARDLAHKMATHTLHGDTKP